MLLSDVSFSIPMRTNLYALLLPFLLNFFTTSVQPYTATDNILVDCGSSSNSTSTDGRHWPADVLSNFLPSNHQRISQIANSTENNNTFIPQQVPYATARVIFSKFTYSFPLLSAGHKFVRLYFYPATYNHHLSNASFFSVVTQNITLLSNFSAFYAVSAIHSPTLVKEYIIYVNDTSKQLQHLDITFLPHSDKKTTSYAFVNGIEIVSIPDTLYHRGNKVPISLVGFNSTYYLQDATPLETVHRLNVGGDPVQAINDTGGMFRIWIPDNNYTLRGTAGVTSSENVQVLYKPVPPYTAPEIVYTSARTMDENSLSYFMTWLLPVDSGFFYLLRLHFCEISPGITTRKQRVFTILINNKTAEPKADVIEWGGGRPHVAVFRDYVAFVAHPDGRKGKKDIWLLMRPSTESLSTYNNALLNGLEIFKLGANGSLSSPNPDISVPVSNTTKQPLQSSLPAVENNKKKRKWWPLLSLVTVGATSLIVVLGFFIFKRRKRVKGSSATEINNANSLCRHFSLDEIKSATNNFDENSVIGVGGFGSVYKGYVDKNSTAVAIKRLNPLSNQGVREFRTEIEMLSNLRHLHLVSLIGCCDESGEMILVYDYMSRGTLRDHLYDTEKPRLPWKRRLQICVGVARGLHYLHTGSEHTIIHRDIKSTNILLDENWVAKVSDFGLSKMGPVGGSKGHVSTVVKGSFGYLDPEYFFKQQLTEKSDVYSFGVVLIETLCACPAITQNFSGEHVNLAEWARVCDEDGILEQITDPTLEGEIAPHSLTKYVDIVFKCLRRKGADRPAMTDVVWNLELALQLQEDAEKVMSFKIREDDYNASPSLLRVQQGVGEPSTSSSGFTNLSIKSHDLFN